MNRTLVRAIAGEESIAFQTYSRAGRSPHWFYILRHKLEELERERTEVTARDIYSFAVLRRNIEAGTMEISFTWLNGDGLGSVSGHQETVILPYDKLEEFIHSSASEGGHASWKALSIDTSKNRPKLVFPASRNLHDAVSDSVIRRRLSRFIRDNFNWPLSEKIVFYNDFAPYSFNFCEYRDGVRALSGGLILHNPENPEKSYYSIHT